MPFVAITVTYRIAEYSGLAESALDRQYKQSAARAHEGCRLAGYMWSC